MAYVGLSRPTSLSVLFIDAHVNPKRRPKKGKQLFEHPLLHQESMAKISAEWSACALSLSFLAGVQSSKEGARPSDCYTD